MTSYLTVSECPWRVCSSNPVPSSCFKFQHRIVVSELPEPTHIRFSPNYKSIHRILFYLERIKYLRLLDLPQIVHMRRLLCAHTAYEQYICIIHSGISRCKYRTFPNANYSTVWIFHRMLLAIELFRPKNISIFLRMRQWSTCVNLAICCFSAARLHIR